MPLPVSRCAPVFVAGLLAAALSAQSTIVIPNGTANTEGNSSNAFPWGRTGLGLLEQCIYDSTNFTLQGVNFPITITRLRWRPNTAASSLASNYATGATVKLSTSPLDWSAVTTTFANQRGPDLTTVFTGPVSWPAAAATTGPCPFLIDIPLTTPFFYDPNGGDLNIEVDLPIQTFTGTGLQLDVQTTGSNSSRVFLSTGYANGGPNATTTSAPTLNHGVVVEITYTPVAGAATIAAYGSGCYDIARSFYENFATAAAFDLANHSLSMFFNPLTNRYTVLPGITSFVPPSPAATTIANGDDVEQIVTLSSALAFPGGTTTSLAVCSNGLISAATGNGTPFTPSSAAFLAFPQACWAPGFHDFNPSITGSGPIQFEEVGSISYVTWNGAWDFGGTTTANGSTMQVQFDRSTGTVHMIWGTMSTLGNGFLVGFKGPGAAMDPGNRDISATLATAFVGGVDSRALRLTGSPRPIVGNTVNLLTSNVPGNSAIGAVVLSYTQNLAGIDLTSIGMPGCRRYVGLDATRTFVPSGGTGTVPLSVPNNAALSGLHLFTQSAVFSSGLNALGVLSSNGLDLQVGTL